MRFETFSSKQRLLDFQTLNSREQPCPRLVVNVRINTGAIIILLLFNTLAYVIIALVLLYNLKRIMLDISFIIIIFLASNKGADWHNVIRFLVCMVYFDLILHHPRGV